MHVNVILNLQKRYETDTKGRRFVTDFSINRLHNRNWQTKVFDSWKVTQLNLLHQKSDNPEVLGQQKVHTSNTDFAPFLL